MADPDSRNVKTPRGYVRGYTAQTVVSEDQVVIAAELNADSPDFGHLEPMVTAAETELTAVGVAESPGVVLADAGSWHQIQMQRAVSRGIQVIIPPDAGKRKGSRPGCDAGLYAFMRRVIASEAGGEPYRKRQGMIDPVFAQVKFNRKIDCFQTKRPGRRTVRMATHRRDPQPSQAPQPSDSPRGGVKGTTSRPSQPTPDRSSAIDPRPRPRYPTATAHGSSGRGSLRRPDEGDALLYVVGRRLCD